MIHGIRLLYIQKLCMCIAHNQGGDTVLDKKIINLEASNICDLLVINICVKVIFWIKAIHELYRYQKNWLIQLFLPVSDALFVRYDHMSTTS